MKRALGYVKQYWYYLLFFIIFVSGCVVFDYFLPIYMGKIINLISGTQPVELHEVLISVLTMLGFSGGGLVSGVLAYFFINKFVTKTNHLLRVDIYNKVIDLPLGQLEQYNPTDLAYNTTQATNFLTYSFKSLFTSIFYGLGLAIAANVLLISGGFKYQLALIIIISLLLFIIVSVIVYLLSKKLVKSSYQLEKDANRLTKSSIDGIRVIRAYNAEGYQLGKLDETFFVYKKNNILGNNILCIISPSLNLISGLMMVVLTYVAAKLIHINQFDFASLSILIQFSLMLLSSCVMIVESLVRLPKTAYIIRVIKSVFNIKENVVYPKESKKTKEEGTLEFKHVNFSYPNDKNNVLNDISFKIKSGESVAFIGPTGSGKSTIFKLINRFYDTKDGEINYDGASIKDFTKCDLHSKIGFVPQKAILFRGTIKENIAMGDSSINNNRINQALNDAGCNEFVKTLPNGINYEINQGGKNVSGGQRQRLCIARAILNNHEMFLFDDCFSALDNNTDKEVRRNIYRRYPKTTKIIISQKIMTIKDVDQIYVLDKGKIVAHGTHDELIKSCKLYQDIASSQLTEKKKSL